MTLAPASRTARAARFAAAAAFAIGSVLGVGVAAALSSPVTGGVAVVFAPGIAGDDATRRILAAGALPVRRGGADNVAIARIEEAATVARLYASGAWLVFGIAIANGCGPEPGRASTRSS